MVHACWYCLYCFLSISVFSARRRRCCSMSRSRKRSSLGWSTGSSTLAGASNPRDAGTVTDAATCWFCSIMLHNCSCCSGYLSESCLVSDSTARCSASASASLSWSSSACDSGTSLGASGVLPGSVACGPPSSDGCMEFVALASAGSPDLASDGVDEARGGGSGSVSMPSAGSAVVLSAASALGAASPGASDTCGPAGCTRSGSEPAGAPVPGGGAWPRGAPPFGVSHASVPTSVSPSGASVGRSPMLARGAKWNATELATKMAPDDAPPRLAAYRWACLGRAC